MNNVTLIGRTTADVESKVVNERKVASFTLAIPEGKESASFIKCSAFDKVADVLTQYVKKGNRIAICGRLHQNSFTKADGTKVSSIEVIVDKLDLLENKAE